VCKKNNNNVNSKINSIVLMDVQLENHVNVLITIMYIRMWRWLFLVLEA